MAAAGARAQKPVGSTAWIAAEKENIADLIEQELEEVEYPVRHEMAWLNEHMTEIFSKGQTNFTDVFKTPGKMRGKTPRTARKRIVEDSRVPLSEIFSSAHKQVENSAIPSPSPFIHRIISKTSAPAAESAGSSQDTNKASQPQYPDLTQNLNSFSHYNTDSGYHGMGEDDNMILPDTQPNTQPETQTSTQPLNADEAVALNSQADVSISQQTTEDSFHSAQENVRARGETVEPMNLDPTPARKQELDQSEVNSQASEPDANATPKAKRRSKSRADFISQNQRSPTPQEETEKQDVNELVSESTPVSEKPHAIQSPAARNPQTQEVEMEDMAKDDTVLDDDFDDIGSPSDGSTPERLPVRKSSLSFASLPAREPLTKKSMGGSRISRTSHIDLPKLNNTGRPSYFGVQKATQPSSDDNVTDSVAMDVDNERGPDEKVDVDEASKLHSTKSTQSLHERISMLGKLQPSRPKGQISTIAGLATGQIPHSELPTTKSDASFGPSNQKLREVPVVQPTAADDDDWIKPLSSPVRPNLTKSQTTDFKEKLSNKDPLMTEKNSSIIQGQRPTESERPKSSYSVFSSPRPQGHQQSASTSNIPAEASTTPTGSPRRFDGPLSASKMRLQSIMKTAKGLFTSTGSSAKTEVSSPEQTLVQHQEQFNHDMEDLSGSQPHQTSSPPRQEGRRTRSSTEKEERRRQKELEDRQREEEEAHQEKMRAMEKQRAMQLRAAQEKSSVEPEERTATANHRSTQSQRQQSREPELAPDTSKLAIAQPKQNDRRPKPTREQLQKPKPQPVSIRLGSTLSRQIPVASSLSSTVQDSNVPAPAPANPSKTLKKKASNQSLQTSSSTSSFKSSVSSQTQAQRKANGRKREQEEREARRKEEQKREQERKRALQLQQQEEARQQAEREIRERSTQEDPKKAAHMQAIEQRRLANIRKHEGQGSQQATNEAPKMQHEKAGSQSSQRSDLGAPRPASRLGSIQPYSRSINPPAPNPAKPPKRVMDEEAGPRPAVRKPSNIQPSGEAKRRKTEDEHNPMHTQPMRPTMAPPIRQSNIRKPSMFGQSSVGHPSGSSIFKTAQPQRPGHPMDMAKFTNGKIPFAEPNHAPPPTGYKSAAPGSAQRPPAQAKPSPKYPSGESIHLPEIATDSEDEDDSDSEMFPVPKWAQPKELEGLLRQQDGMEVDSIFGPIAPFSLEETFKADKKIKRYRDRTSSANWNGPDGLTQEEIRKDVAERQRLRLNGGWSFNP
ncbi:hypothetical protein N7462_008140 [Penicillium macrosclerotiorum]|uniref:uncharacterized protein n=1 Tax=Penicillium macrosclerotiorum TaxID=303699 RepID=UPI0025470EA4|nr:uncharacterized protein N7462_008140 [Penicillium macrosclerotiorum]KAJ5679896.1 hypothetical protein N7462_008140 [Penicillium macrosclerotiorum]